MTQQQADTVIRDMIFGMAFETVSKGDPTNTFSLINDDQKLTGEIVDQVADLLTSIGIEEVSVDKSGDTPQIHLKPLTESAQIQAAYYLLLREYRKHFTNLIAKHYVQDIEKLDEERFSQEQQDQADTGQYNG